jgi:hypothetical protein
MAAILGGHLGFPVMQLLDKLISDFIEFFGPENLGIGTKLIILSL